MSPEPDETSAETRAHELDELFGHHPELDEHGQAAAIADRERLAALFGQQPEPEAEPTSQHPPEASDDIAGDLSAIFGTKAPSTDGEAAPADDSLDHVDAMFAPVGAKADGPAAERPVQVDDDGAADEDLFVDEAVADDMGEAAGPPYVRGGMSDVRESDALVEEGAGAPVDVQDAEADSVSERVDALADVEDAEADWGPQQTASYPPEEGAGAPVNVQDAEAN